MPTFEKYSGGGNTFLILESAPLSASWIQKSCDPTLGAAADGVIFYQKSPPYDASMRIFNSDGQEAAFCGNGLRCLFFALFRRQWIEHSGVIQTACGPKKGWMDAHGHITTQMCAPRNFTQVQIEHTTGYRLCVGVDHLVLLSPPFSFANTARTLRHTFDANVHFVTHDTHTIETFEKGVEAPTLCCGSGTAAAAFVLHKTQHIPFPLVMHASCATLTVTLQEKILYLQGPTDFIFEGQMR